MADKKAEVKVDKLGDTKPKPNDELVISLADRLAKVEGDELGKEQSKKKAKAQEDKGSENVTKSQVNTFGDLLLVVRAHA